MAKGTDPSNALAIHKKYTAHREYGQLRLCPGTTESGSTLIHLKPNCGIFLSCQQMFAPFALMLGCKHNCATKRGERTPFYQGRLLVVEENAVQVHWGADRPVKQHASGDLYA